jgi:hypothetical protein
MHYFRYISTIKEKAVLFNTVYDPKSFKITHLAAFHFDSGVAKEVDYSILSDEELELTISWLELMLARNEEI